MMMTSPTEPMTPNDRIHGVDLSDRSEYTVLSSLIDHQLNVESVGLVSLLHIITLDKLASEGDREIVTKALVNLLMGFRGRRRALGPPAVLHSMLSGALYARAVDEAGLDVQGVILSLLHDVLEDVLPWRVDGSIERDVGMGETETHFDELVEVVGCRYGFDLEKQLRWLTRTRSDETYRQYNRRLIEQARGCPEVIRAKLCDRLDNTLDMRAAVGDPLDEQDFYETIFRILWLNRQKVEGPPARHLPITSFHGGVRAYQLYKNVILLSSLREQDAIQGDPVAERLFRAIASASKRHASHAVLHIFRHHFTDISAQREVLLETMRYSLDGGCDRVTRGSGENPLDGVFFRTFAMRDKAARRRSIEELYTKKSLLVRIALGLICTMTRFMNEEDYYIRDLEDID